MKTLEASFDFIWPLAILQRTVRNAVRVVADVVYWYDKYWKGILNLHSYFYAPAFSQDIFERV